MLVHDVFLISRFREAMVCRMLRGILLSHILPRNPAAKVRRAVHFFLNPAGGIHTGSTTQVASPGKGGGFVGGTQPHWEPFSPLEIWPATR